MFKTTLDILKLKSGTDENNPVMAIPSAKEGSWIYLSQKQCQQRMQHFAGILNSSGVIKGDRVLILAQMAFPDLVIFDLAVQSVSAISVMANPDMMPQELSLILEESAPKIVIFGSDEIQKNALYKWFNYPEYEYFTLSRFVQDGLINDIGDLDLQPEPETSDCCSVIYTSGSTGTPKGVMLSHQNIVSNISAVLPLFPIGPGSRVLSILPYSHVFERSVVYSYLALGACVYFPGERERVAGAFQSAKPHFVAVVPKILEQIHENILRELLQKPQWIRWIWMPVWYAVKYPDHPLTFLTAIPRKILFRGLKKRLGGNLRAMICGAAALPSHLEQLFERASIPIRQGYGMTEASPVITVNRFEKGLYRKGSVGLPLRNVNIKLIDDEQSGQSEICIKGPNVMLGYYKNKGRSQEVIDSEGWLHTGDMGTFDEDGFLFLNGRKKDMFKTTSGKFVIPETLEMMLCELPLIRQAAIFGSDKPFVVAIIVPDEGALKYRCEKEHVYWTSLEYMVHNVRIQDWIKDEVRSLNTTLQSFQRIKSLHINIQLWTPENKLLTATYKLKRLALANHYKEVLIGLYTAQNIDP